MDKPCALVVGATSEVGGALARVLADLGHDLVLWGRRVARLEQVADQVRSVGAEVETAVVDVTDAEALRGAADTLGGSELRVAVWTPGLFSWGRPHQVDPQSWRRLVEVNLTAPVEFTALVAPLLVANAPSSLVYLGSGAGHQAFANNAAYVASKHGVAGLAEAAFLDLRDHGVKVSLISPGPIATGAGLLSPAGQQRPADLLSVDDVAAALRFILSSSTSCCPTQIRLQPLRTPLT